jgi:hypothetical protein
MLSRKPVIVGALIACLGTFLAMVAINAQGGTGLADGGISSDLPMTSSADATQEDAFGVLRRTQTAGDAIGAGAGAPFGANGQLARAVSTPVGTVRIVPGNGWLCLRAEDTVGSAWTCGPNERVSSEGLFLTLREATTDSGTLYGLVPDAADTAELRAAGKNEDLTIADNILAARISGPASITFYTTHGATTVPAP